jgi:hypothetical protein
VARRGEKERGMMREEKFRRGYLLNKTQEKV